MRRPESEILKPPAVRAWFAPFAFAAIAILVVSGLQLYGRGPTREAAEMPAPLSFAAPAHLATRIVRGSDSELVRSEAGQSNPPVSAPVPTPVASVSTAAAPSPIAPGSQASGILTGKQREIAALPLVGLPVATRREKSHRQRGDQSGRGSDRAIAVNNCRQILRKERPLMHYSIRDTVQDADQEAVPVANACARTIASLAKNGKECAGLFSWFDVFQTRLTSHVNRVCSEAVSKSTTP